MVETINWRKASESKPLNGAVVIIATKHGCKLARRIRDKWIKISTTTAAPIVESDDNYYDYKEIEYWLPIDSLPNPIS